MDLSLGMDLSMDLQTHLIQQLEQNLDTITGMSKIFYEDDKRFKKEIFEIYKSTSNIELNKDLIVNGIEYAIKQSLGRYRDSGDPEVVHPFRVASILASFNISDNVILAGLTHDILEDDLKNKIQNMNYIFNKFGVQTFLIDVALTKNLELSKEKIGDKEMYERIKAFKKVFLIRYVDHVKVADNMDNLYSIENMVAKKGMTKEERQNKFIKTTKEHVLPLAYKIDLQGKIELQLVPYINELISRYEN
jgi:(p)ppGpp synthase/HD superfamily hydrolase